MNVGHPSNLARLLALYGGVMDEKGNIFEPPRMDEMQQEIWSTSISDEQTRQTIREAWETQRLLLEPHGAVGWAGLNQYLAENPGDEVCISIETAHPAKFPEEIIHLLGFDPELPQSLIGIETKNEQYSLISSSYADFKEYLRKSF
jgi:threonine synthase